VVDFFAASPLFVVALLLDLNDFKNELLLLTPALPLLFFDGVVVFVCDFGAELTDGGFPRIGRPAPAALEVEATAVNGGPAPALALALALAFNGTDCFTSTPAASSPPRAFFASSLPLLSGDGFGRLGMATGAD